MNNDGSGCAGTILAGVLLALVLAVAVAWTGLPTWDAGALNWNTDATHERQLTERERIAAENETERQRIAANAETSRAWAMALAVMVTVGSTAGAVVAWSRRPHRPRPEPAHVVNLLTHFPGYITEFNPEEGEWTIVEPMTGEYYTVTDAARLLEMRHEF